MTQATTTIARPYAKAAFEFALQQKKINEWSVFLEKASLVVSDPEVVELLLNPRFTEQQALDFIAGLSIQEAEKFQQHFLEMLVQNKRLLCLPAIETLFESYRAEQEGTVVVEVTSAFPFESSKQEQLLKALKIRLQRQVELTFHTDSELIGGALIRAGDLVIDGSVKGQLAQLKEVLEK